MSHPDKTCCLETLIFKSSNYYVNVIFYRYYSYASEFSIFTCLFYLSFLLVIFTCSLYLSFLIVFFTCLFYLYFTCLFYWSFHFSLVILNSNYRNWYVKYIIFFNNYAVISFFYLLYYSWSAKDGVLFLLCFKGYMLLCQFCC